MQSAATTAATASTGDDASYIGDDNGSQSYASATYYHASKEGQKRTGFGGQRNYVLIVFLTTLGAIVAVGSMGACYVFKRD
jgi:hypothetical protein